MVRINKLKIINNLNIDIWGYFISKKTKNSLPHFLRNSYYKNIIKINISLIKTHKKLIKNKIFKLRRYSHPYKNKGMRGWFVFRKFYIYKYFNKKINYINKYKLQKKNIYLKKRTVNQKKKIWNKYYNNKGNFWPNIKKKPTYLEVVKELDQEKGKKGIKKKYVKNKKEKIEKKKIRKFLKKKNFYIGENQRFKFYISGKKYIKSKHRAHFKIIINKRWVRTLSWIWKSFSNRKISLYKINHYNKNSKIKFMRYYNDYFDLKNFALIKKYRKKRFFGRSKFRKLPITHLLFYYEKKKISSNNKAGFSKNFTFLLKKKKKNYNRLLQNFFFLKILKIEDVGL